MVPFCKSYHIKLNLKVHRHCTVFSIFSDSVQATLSGRCSVLLLELTNNVLQAEKVFQSFVTSPSLKKGMPPTASALLWLQGFQKRLEDTAKQCEHFSLTLLGTEEGWTLRNLQNSLMEQVLRYVRVVAEYSELSVVVCTCLYLWVSKVITLFCS